VSVRWVVEWTFYANANLAHIHARYCWRSRRQGAVVTCLAKGGPAEANGAVQIGDSVIYVDDLDVRELMNNVRSHPYLLKRKPTSCVA